jgi:polyhydroxybutyrate depolymerase
MSGDLSRKVRLFVPSSYDGHTKLSLVLNLHGSGDNADNFANLTQLEQVAEMEGFVVAGLEAVTGMWNVPPEAGKPDDVTYAIDTIEDVSSRLCIDRARVYATGFSGGGRMSSRLGCMIPDRIAAIGPVAGVRFPGPCPGRPVPVLTIHGLADSVNVYAGEGPEHPRWSESVEEAVSGWAMKNGCNPARVVDDPAGVLSSFTYEPCQTGATVRLIRMDGVDHVYPTGEPLHAAREVWSFVKGYALPEPP